MSMENCVWHERMFLFSFLFYCLIDFICFQHHKTHTVEKQCSLITTVSATFITMRAIKERHSNHNLPCKTRNKTYKKKSLTVKCLSQLTRWHTLLTFFSSESWNMKWIFDFFSFFFKTQSTYSIHVVNSSTSTFWNAIHYVTSQAFGYHTMSDAKKISYLGSAPIVGYYTEI